MWKRIVDKPVTEVILKIAKKKKKGSNLNAQHQRIEHHTTEYYIDITEYTIQNFNNDIRNAYNLIIVGHEYQQL